MITICLVQLSLFFHFKSLCVIESKAYLLWIEYSWWCFPVVNLCPTLCDPVDCSTPGLPGPHYLPEFAQIHVHWIGDAIQPSYPLLSFSPFVFILYKHQGLRSCIAVAQSLSHVWLCDCVDCSMPGFPVLHCLPKSLLWLLFTKWFCFLIRCLGLS